MKRAAIVILTVVLMVSFVLINGETALAKKVKWKVNLWCSRVDAYPQTTLVADMVARVLKRSGGNFNIKLHTSGQLGIKSKDFLKACSDGALDGFMIYSGAMSGDVPEFDVPYLPYLGTTTKDKKVIDDILRPRYTQALAKYNTQPLVAVTWGFTYPLMTKPLPSIMDWSGMKLRVVNPWQSRMCSEMGGEGAPIPYSEVYTALQRGAVQGEISSIPTVLSRPDPGLYKHIYILNIGMGLYTFIVNKDSLAKLPAEYRNILLEESAKTEKEGWASVVPIDQQEIAGVKAMKEKYGAKIYYATPEQLKALSKKNAFIWDMWAEKRDRKDLLKKVLDQLGM